MICTAREAMKKHSTKVALWIVWKKFLALKKERNLLNQDKAINNKCKNNLFSFGNLRKFF